MSTNVVLFDPKQRPEYALVKQEASAITKALTGGGGFGKRLSIKGGVFRLVADGKEVASIEDRHLDVVIVRAAEHISRTFYAASYDEDNPAPPDCWSADGLTPDSSVKEPQSPQCANCPQNAKGSGKDESRACRFSQRVAVVLANDVEGDVLQLQVPAKSLFGKEEGENRPLQAYARFLAANNANIEQFITRLKFDLKAESPKLFFKPMRWLSEEEFEVIKAKGASADAVQACTMTVAQVDKVPGAGLPPKPPAAAAPAAPAAPAPDAEPPAAPPSVGKKPRKATAAPAPAAPAAPAEDAEPPAPAPTLRKAAEAAPAPAKASLSELAKKWDDED